METRPAPRNGPVHCRPITFLFCAGVVGVALPAQRQVALLADVTGQQPAKVEDDEGPTVELFQSPNLDRYLRRAQDFLGREDFQQAITVLQDVIEGRTMEAVVPVVGEGGSPGTAATPATPDQGKPDQPKPDQPKPDPKRNDKPPAGTELPELADPAKTVFSQDGRIYRPVRRLCHELLATMPLVGIELYRSQYEARAQELLDEALRTGSDSMLEAVANRWFVTLAAGKAMQLLADRMIHDGRYRAAIQVLRDLSELYPNQNLGRLGISPLWCQFKIALSMRLSGDVDGARDRALAMAEKWPDESLRVMGELQPVKTLADSPLLAGAGVVGDVQPVVEHEPSWLGAPELALVPLWQYRHRTPDPYKGIQTRDNNRNIIVFGESVASSAAPPATKYGNGTHVAFLGSGSPEPRAVFLDHFKLRIADSFTGLLLAEGDGEDKVPAAQDNRPRVRVPVYDFALQRIVEDDRSYFAILGFSHSSQSIEVLKENSLVAYDKHTGARLWSTAEFLEGEDGYREVTFLSAPTLFGERLLAPVLRRGAYALQAIDRHSGRPLWCTRIHAGGSTYFKAPGTPVLVRGSMAYVLTNAGALAAIDAFTGDLRWIRKNERSHPLRDKPVVRRSNARENAFMGRVGMQYVEQDLPSFLPSEIVAAEGTLIVAPCDSEVVLCLDGASGEPVWMIDGNSRYAGYGRIHYIVGANSRFVYFATESDLLCVQRDSGVRLWSRTLPIGSNSLTRWRGRGSVLEDFVIMPGDRELLVIDAEGENDWRRLPLPSFGVGDAPLGGPNNIAVDGPWLSVTYAGGIEVYSSQQALRGLAADEEDVATRATMLVQAGDFDGAMQLLEKRLSQRDPETPADAERRRELAEQLVAFARERALAEGAGGIRWLDRVRPFAEERSVRMLWHLARLEFFKAVQDLRAYEQEQQKLYRLMEGKD